jgi:hypothetical protein
MTSTALSDWRRPLWLVLLIASSVAFTLGFACAVPFAAFAAIAATTLSRRDGLWLAFGLWLANQAIGFGFMNYPTDPITIAWGLALGIIAIVTTAAAYWIHDRMQHAEKSTRAIAAFAVAFVVYEGTLALLSLTPLGGKEDFVIGIVAYILALNVVAAVGLYAMHRIATAVGFVSATRGEAANAR